MNDSDVGRCLIAAAAAERLTGSTPISAGLIRTGPVKSTFIVELPDTMAVLCGYQDQARCSAALQAMAWAHRNGLGPQPLAGEMSEDGPCLSPQCWTGYHLVRGRTLEARKHLTEIYADLGRFIAGWHGCAERIEARPALSRYCQPVVPSDVRDRAQMLASPASRWVNLHGDLNAANVIAGPCLLAIDFDEFCLGPAELDLALALAYVNTAPEDLRLCLTAMTSAYRAAGQAINDRNVVEWLKLMPWFLAAAEHERVCAAAPVPGMTTIVAAQQRLIDTAFGTGAAPG